MRHLTTRRAVLDEPLPLIPDLSDVHDVDALITQYAPELKSHVDREFRRVIWFGLGGLFVLIAVALSVGGVVSPAEAMLTGLATVGVVGAANELFALLERRMGERDYRRLVERRPDVLYGKVADKFKDEIQGYRVRMLGPDSDWHKARAPLKEAQDEAARSTAYWAERLRQDPGNSLAEHNLATAEELRLKFTAALDELDHRSDALLTFLNECYAKLTVLESSRSDIAESRRLATLTEHAGDIVSEAEDVLRTIGEQFVREAASLGGALGALRALQLKETAGETPVDEIEEVADRILSVYSEDTAALKRLMSTFGSDPSSTYGEEG